MRESKREHNIPVQLPRIVVLSFHIDKERLSDFNKLLAHAYNKAFWREVGPFSDETNYPPLHLNTMSRLFYRYNVSLHVDSAIKAIR